MFKIGGFFKSFEYAFRGLLIVFKEEQSFRVQIFAAFIVFGLAIFFHVSVWEAITLIIIVSSVLVLEILNSILERLVDALKPRIHPYVKVIKDMMAAAVLLASMAALIIGISIFVRHL